MRRRDAERIARGAVPGSAAPRVSLLSAGLRHHTYRVERDGRAFSMRLAGAGDEGWVLRVLQLAAAQALAPPLVFGDAERGIIVQEWIEGCMWPSASVRQRRNLERMAALLKRVHALPPPEPARVSSPAVWVRYYSDALAARPRAVKRSAKSVLAAAAGRQLKRLEMLPGMRGVVCHSDLHRLNVLEYRRPRSGPKALVLLDWEYAHVSEPFWDLAGWSANNDLTDELLRGLLAAYLGRTPDEADWTRAQLLGWLYDYVCILWSELYVDSRRAGPAAAARAAVLQARLLASRV